MRIFGNALKCIEFMNNLLNRRLTLTIALFLTSFQLIFGQVNGHYYFIENDSIIVSRSNDTLNNPWTGGFNSSQISKIDLNGDAFEDLFVFDRTGNSIIPFIWNPDKESWKYAPEYINDFPKLSYWALLRDYNCDGRKDIFSYVSGGVGVWLNTSQNNELSFEYVTHPYLRATLLGGTVANLYVSKVDIPDINDVDGDGDLDVLTFGIIGNRLEYYQNQSQELGFGCDSLLFEIMNTCWGHFLEDGTNTNVCTLKDTCASGSNVANPKGLAKHSGSTTLSLDLNDDGVKDVLLGDVSFNNVVALYNDNKGVNMNTSFLSQDTAFPNNTTPVDLYVFPATFYEDVDMDGKRDLISSPNTDNGSENYDCIWFYKNYGTNTSPLFSHIENDFLQNESIELGTNAYPILLDYNNDGLLDLFIGNFGYFNKTTHVYKGKVALYENIGSSSNPIFSWVTDDFASISSLGFGSGIYPTFGDVDNDNDLDMIVGDHDGKIHLFLNSSGNLSTMTLSLSNAQMEDDNNNVIDIGYAAKPQLFDLDGDDDLDLIIGEENGNLNFYENMGSTSSYSFRLQTENLGGIDVSEWWTTIGNSAPTFFKNTDGTTQLFVGSANGQIHHYNNIDGNVFGTFTEIDTNIFYFRNTTNSCVAVGWMDNDTLLDMIVGNERGGLSYFKGSNDISLTQEEITPLENKLYPNPVNSSLFIKGETPHHICVYDLNGKVIIQTAYTNILYVEDLIEGIYIIELRYEHRTNRQKFIKR